MYPRLWLTGSPGVALPLCGGSTTPRTPGLCGWLETKLCQSSPSRSGTRVVVASEKEGKGRPSAKWGGLLGKGRRLDLGIWLTCDPNLSQPKHRYATRMMRTLLCDRDDIASQPLLWILLRPRRLCVLMCGAIAHRHTGRAGDAYALAATSADVGGVSMGREAGSWGFGPLVPLWESGTCPRLPPAI